MNGDISWLRKLRSRAAPRQATHTRAWAALPLSEGGKQLAAWAVLGLINQALISVRLPGTSFSSAALHRIYDFGQLLALGAISFCAVALGQRVLRAIPQGFAALAGPALIAVATFTIALLIIGEETANFASRHGLAPGLVRLSSALVFASAMVAIAVVPLPAFRFVSPALLLAGAALAIANAYVLDEDYPALHFMVAWLGSQLLVRGVDGKSVPVRISRRVIVISGVVAGAASVTTLVLVPRMDVLRRLYSLSSSVAAPIVARFIPEQGAVNLALVPAEYRESPWFRPREKLPAIPPTAAYRTPAQPIVLLLTIDAVRADVLSDKRNRKTLPVLSQLMTRSVYFSHAWSPSPATVVTMTSIFSGKYYSGLLYERIKSGSVMPINDRSVRVPALLSAAGVQTLNVVVTPILQANSGPGVGFAMERLIEKRSRDKGRQAVDILIEELEELGPHPAFFWTHFIEPHAPYDAGGKKGTPFQRYLREVRIVDEQIGRLLKYLEEKGLDQRTILIVSSDHGEAFGEHGRRYHARTLYEELLRVPLMIRLPGVAAREVKTPVTLIDLGPTVLDLFGLPTPAAFMGESLVPTLVGKPQELSRPIAAESVLRQQALYLKDGKKVIFDLLRHTIEVYDLNQDPKEKRDLLEHGADVAAEVETARLFFEVQRLKKPGWTPPHHIDL